MTPRLTGAGHHNPGVHPSASPRSRCVAPSTRRAWLTTLTLPCRRGQAFLKIASRRGSGRRQSTAGQWAVARPPAKGWCSGSPCLLSARVRSPPGAPEQQSLPPGSMPNAPSGHLEHRAAQCPLVARRCRPCQEARRRSDRVADSAAAGHEPGRAPVLDAAAADSCPTGSAGYRTPRNSVPATRPSPPCPGMIAPGTLVYQPVTDVTQMPSPISVAITSRFMPIEGCRQHMAAQPRSQAFSFGWGTTEGTEIALDTWAAFASDDLLDQVLLERMLAGVPTAVTPTSGALGSELEARTGATGRSAVCRGASFARRGGPSTSSWPATSRASTSPSAWSTAFQDARARDRVPSVAGSPPESCRPATINGEDRSRRVA